MKPVGDYSGWKFISNSPKKPRLGHYKGDILAYDKSFVYKTKKNLDMRSLAIVLTILRVRQQTQRTL